MAEGVEGVKGGAHLARVEYEAQAVAALLARQQLLVGEIEGGLVARRHVERHREEVGVARAQLHVRRLLLLRWRLLAALHHTHRAGGASLGSTSKDFVSCL